MNLMLMTLLLNLSNVYNIEPAVVMAVIHYESKFDMYANGGKGEVGLMQLMPEYFGHKKSKLYDPALNIRLGIHHLHYSRKYCKHQEDLTWLVCYNVGVTGGNKIKHPKKFKYYKEVYPLYQAYSKFVEGHKQEWQQ